MSRNQTDLIGLLSLVATALVLVSAASRAPHVDLAKLAAEHRSTTVHAPALADSTPSSDNGAAADVADDSPASDASDGTDPSASNAPAEAAPTTPAAEDTDRDTSSDPEPAPPAADEPKPTKIKHVFVIALAGHGFDATFGDASPATYLNRTLRPKGVLLEGYRTLGSADLPDHLAIVGGQPPNAETRAGCPTFQEIPPTSAPSKAGVIAAAGCVFPNTVVTIGDQLSASRRPWRAYLEDLDKGTPQKATCRHPESNGPDDTSSSRPGDGYATRRNPFVYFHSLLDLGDCDAYDGPLTKLDHDLRSIKSTASYSYVAPNLCNAGSESPCLGGSPGGLAAADAFLAKWVPKILASPAYKADGLLIVTFAGKVPDLQASADAPVRTGALLVSRFAQAGTTAAGDYTPYSLLRSVEDLFALKPLALAATARSFAPTVLGRAYAEPPSDG